VAKENFQAVKRETKLKHGDETLKRMLLAAELASAPANPTADAYRLAAYADGLVGAANAGRTPIIPGQMTRSGTAVCARA